MISVRLSRDNVNGFPIPVDLDTSGRFCETPATKRGGCRGFPEAAPFLDPSAASSFGGYVQQSDDVGRRQCTEIDLLQGYHPRILLSGSST